MHISERGLRLIEQYEGFVDHQYDDGTGVMTIGYGTTAADISPLPKHLTRQQAEDLLRKKLAEKYEPAVNEVGVPLNQNQFDALCSFVYNIGPGGLAPNWRIGAALRNHDYWAAAASLLLYVNAGGQRLQGLVNRREAERQLFLTPVTPVDPHYYNRYDTTTRQFGTWTGTEVGVVKEYDRTNHVLHPIRTRQLRTLIKEFRDRISLVAHNDSPPSWGVNHRGWRWQQLNKRL